MCVSRECVLLPSEPGDIVSCTCFQYAVIVSQVREKDDGEADWFTQKEPVIALCKNFRAKLNKSSGV